MKIDLKYYNELTKLAEDNGFTVTSGLGGKHNTNSLHPLGLAIDVRTRDKKPKQVEAFIQICKNAGFKVLDERTRPLGQKVWGGPHLHIQVADKSIIDYARAMVKAGKDIVYSNAGAGALLIAAAAFFFYNIYK